MRYSDFEQNVHALVLERGQEYYASGAVVDLSPTAEGWSADIRGSDEDNYRVIIRGKEEVEEWFCDCPYDHGPVCKHVIATLFAVREREEELEFVRGELLDKLKDIEGEALKKFLQERMLVSKNFRNAFIEYFQEEEE